MIHSLVCAGLALVGGKDAMHSPLLHLHLSHSEAGQDTEATLQAIVDLVLQQHGALLGLHRTSPLDRITCPASIKVLATALLTEADIAALGVGLRAAAAEVLGDASRQ
jgi:hypothetical protein